MTWLTVVIDTTNMDASSDDASQARAQIKQMADNINIIKDARGQSTGLASLDAGSKVPLAELPTIPENQGGTGQTAYSVGDILYASASGTLTKLAASTLGYVLTSNGPGNAPSWQQAGGGLVSGTRMPFNQTAAPTGWTKDTTYNDSIMRIVSGTVSAGGSLAFSTFNGQTATGAHTLTTAQIPAHTHTLNTTNFSSPVIYGDGESLAESSNIYNTGGFTGRSSFINNAGSGGSHSHSLTHNIKYNDFIIAQKD
jgi:hypothetical protein